MIAFAQPYFTYAALKGDCDSIRLLAIARGNADESISCYMREQHLPRNCMHNNRHCRSSYYALSHCWGKLASTKRWIILDGKQFQVQRALFQALKSIRSLCEKSDRIPGWLWVDAICIDQCNVEKKNKQIGLMARIYSEAAGVFAWLGPSAIGSNMMFEWIRNHADKLDSAPEPGPDLCNTILTFCNRSYWTRAWVQQELFFSRDLYILCGDSSVPWDDFCLVCFSLSNIRERTPKTYAGFFLEGNRATDSSELGSKAPSLEDLICRGPKGRACSDPRDGIFSLLSMASDTNQESKTLEAMELIAGESVDWMKHTNGLVYLTRDKIRSFIGPGEKLTSVDISVAAVECGTRVLLPYVLANFL